MTADSSPRSPGFRAAVLAAVLLALDLAVIAGDLLRRGLLYDVRFAVTTEGGYGEWFQYAKATALALLLIAARRRARAALVWAVLFIYILLDDPFALHELFGRWAASALALRSFGAMQPEHLGEVVVLAGVGSAFLAALVLPLVRDAASRRLTLLLAPPFAALALFGVVGDAAHSLARGSRFRYAAGLIEDGGEMVAMSVLVAVAYWATRRA